MANGHIVVKEAEIRKKIDLEGLSVKDMESQIRAIVEKSGVDYGRTVHEKGVAPNREWANHSKAFEPTPEEQAALDAERKAKELQEMSALDAEKAKTRALEAELAQMRKIDKTLHVKEKQAA